MSLRDRRYAYHYAIKVAKVLAAFIFGCMFFTCVLFNNLGSFMAETLVGLLVITILMTGSFFIDQIATIIVVAIINVYDKFLVYVLILVLCFSIIGHFASGSFTINTL